jgi:putative RecB family exonuclease
MVPPPHHLSPSSASTFEQCPRRWRLKYVDKLPDPSGRAALVGGFAHRVLELLCGLPRTQRTREQAKDLARACWPEIEADPDYQALQLDEAGAREFRWAGWAAIAGLWTLEDPATVDVLGTERTVETTLAGVPFVGIVDRVDALGDDLVVTDYKSGTLPSSRFQDDKVTQVLLYAAALEASDGRRPDRARLLYLGQRSIDIPVDDGNLSSAVEALAGTWQAVGTACTDDRFDSRPGVLCGWCPYVGRCDEGRQEILRRQGEGILPAHAPAAAALALVA